MAQQRKVRKIGNSWVVALPADIRRRLGVSGKNAVVYWHGSTGKEAIVTRGAARAGGRPGSGDLSAHLDQARAEIERLQAKLAARPAAVYREGFAAGAMQALKVEMAHEELLRKLDERLAGWLTDAAARVRVLRVPTPPPARQRSARPASTTPAPEPPPSVVVAGGDAASGGAATQAAHE